jgi:hypothetical protein
MQVVIEGGDLRPASLHLLAEVSRQHRREAPGPQAFGAGLSGFVPRWLN